jgi:ribonuclease BN (tRNA processing enzyme)
LDGGTGLASLQTTLMRGAWGRGAGALHLLLSHFHWDHVIGLPFFRPMFVPGNRIVFYGASVEDLRSGIERLFTSIYSPLEGAENVAAALEYRQVEPKGMEVAGFQVWAVETRHTASALAFRIQYGPHAVVYSPDHGAGDREVDARLVGLARGANLWILDAQYMPQERPDRQSWGHSSHLEALALAVEAGVDMAVLFHHDPAHDDETLDRIGLEAAQATAGTGTQVLMARDGMVVDVGKQLGSNSQ